MVEPANLHYRVEPGQEPPNEQAMSGGMPDGVATNDMWYWDGSAWALLTGPDADYKVLQRNADDTIGWSWVRAH